MKGNLQKFTHPYNATIKFSYIKWIPDENISYCDDLGYQIPLTTATFIRAYQKSDLDATFDQLRDTYYIAEFYGFTHKVIEIFFESNFEDKYIVKETKIGSKPNDPNLALISNCSLNRAPRALKTKPGELDRFNCKDHKEDNPPQIGPHLSAQFNDSNESFVRFNSYKWLNRMRLMFANDFRFSMQLFSQSF